MPERKKDIFETLSDEELMRQVLENPSDSSAHQHAAFLMNYRLAMRQAAFNKVVTIATVIMAIQAAASVVTLCVGR